MDCEIRRPAQVTSRMAVTALIALAGGIWLIWSAMADVPVNRLVAALCAALILWAFWGVWNLLRPILLRLSQDGVYAQGPFGNDRFGWADLLRVDFTRPAQGAVLCFRKPNGKEGAIVLPRRSVDDSQHAKALLVILMQRPDVPTANPKPWVTLTGTK